MIHFTTFFVFINSLSSNQDTQSVPLGDRVRMDGGAFFGFFLLIVASQVEDVLNKKKPPPQILDLNGMEISSKEEFKVAFDKIPDYKIRKEKVNEVWRWAKSIQLFFQQRNTFL